MKIFVISLALVIVGAAAPAHAGFDFGGDCSSGEGQFDQPIGLNLTVEVGVIPARKAGVTIELTSAQDVDIQLIDQQTGHQIIAWPNGDLNGPGHECTTFQQVTYCYSGYNGVGGNWGHETIEVRGDTNRPLVMRAFGYASGNAIVEYAWSATPTCYEKGDGEFQQPITTNAVVTVGDIPAGLVNVEIELETLGNRDVDVQLYEGNVALVQWPYGNLSGPNAQTLNYRNLVIEYSGYNGVGGNRGHETITVRGAITRKLTMKAFGYQSGDATVTYHWGEGAGATCLGIATLQCLDGYQCKSVQTGVSDPAGSCHTEQWCDPASVQSDCASLFHVATPGAWNCEAFKCAWRDSCNADSDCNGGFCGWTSSNARVCKPWGTEGAQCGGFVLPAARNFCAPALSCVPDPNDATGDVPGTCRDLTCSMFQQACPSGYTCQFGCPNALSCGINPPGVCVPQ